MYKFTSYVHFEQGAIHSSTNDGMELLGHFLLTRVGGKADFFIQWTKHQNDYHELSSGAYFLVKEDDVIDIEHLDDDGVFPFSTSVETFIEILKKWEAYCKNDSCSACNAKGYDLIISRTPDAVTYTFETING